MASKKLFGNALTGHGASLAGIGGLVAERNRRAQQLSDTLGLLPPLVFAYLPKWQAARLAARRRRRTATTEAA